MKSRMNIGMFFPSSLVDKFQFRKIIKGALPYTFRCIMRCGVLYRTKASLRRGRWQKSLIFDGGRDLRHTTAHCFACGPGSLPQSASLTAPSSEGAFAHCTNDENLPMIETIGRFNCFADTHLIRRSFGGMKKVTAR